MDVNAKKALKIRIRFGNVCAFVLVEDTLKNHPLASIKQIQVQIIGDQSCCKLSTKVV
ncbi:hypothetical protein HanXRQr2_Chr15g0716141 [Helianthus annuus]|uniref:Uncharacterized protein n=1 Tax=Helianthus annuus TaxID=4232 RepID=A0A251SCK5_HELAN|nr:hypothetical protein HanXRQr2_Chr15g0716141 [Helianthus annuus]KAJ0833172.1 hypothetical protein HanPSC8_Chr15g0687191 [Helianthus annuus]